jgi:hypothetical protein
LQALVEKPRRKVIIVAQQVENGVRARVGWVFTFAAAAYNLVRMRNLLPIAT